MWKLFLLPGGGPMSNIFGWFGLESEFLGGPNAFYWVIVVQIWANAGFTMVIFLAGMQTIPADLYEAASVDGATGWQQFRYVTIPQLRPVTLFALVITSIGYLQVFEEPFVMTQGGPLDSTLTVAMVIYEEGFNFFHLGYASAIAYMLFLAIAVLAFIQFRFLGQDD